MEDKDTKGLTGRSQGFNTIDIPGELESRTRRGVTVAAGTVYDYGWDNGNEESQGAFQEHINRTLKAKTESINNTIEEVINPAVSKIPVLEDKIDNNTPYTILYENQCINIPCDAYGNYTGDEEYIQTVVRLFYGSIVKLLSEQDGITPVTQITGIEVIESSNREYATIAVTRGNINNLEDSTEFNFKLKGESEIIVNGKVIFNKVRQGKSAYEIWKDQDGNEGKSLDDFWAFLTADKGYTKIAISYEDFNALDATTVPTNVIYVHPNSTNTEYYAKVSNGNTWVELLRNNGDISNIPQIETDAKNDFSIRDEQDNAIVEFSEGHIKTKNFDSSQAVTQDELSSKESEIREDIPDVSGFPTIVDDDADFSIKDENDNAILKVENGHIKTKNFDSENIEFEGDIKVEESDSDLSFEDENDNTIIKLVGGHIITKNFDSRKIVKSKYVGDIIHPFAIYTTCNDIPNNTNDGNLNRNLSQAVYLDHFINGLTEEKNIRFKDAVDKIVFTSPMEVTNSAEVNRPTEFNNGANIFETNKVLTINGYDIDEQSFNVLHRSTLNSVTKDVHPKVLVIGASVTHGEMATIPNDNYTQNYVYHLITKQLFMKDKIDNGNNGFDITFLGRNERTNTFEYKGTSYTCKTHHEGYRGYSLLDFLESTKASVAGFHSTTTNRFSLVSYIDRFRTMDDEGNRLPWVSAGASVTGLDGKTYTIGTEINTESKLNSIDVCTPTHVVSALGLNANATVEEFEELVTIIKTEYPTMEIGIALCDSSGTFFPSLHPHTDDKCIVWNDTSSRHDKLFKLMEGLQNRFCNSTDENNGIYLIPFFFVSPTAEGVSARYAPLPDAEINLTENNKYYSSFGWIASIHTNGYGHMNWGYSLYSWLKYSIAKSLE